MLSERVVEASHAFSTKYRLTPRELQILKLFLEGQNNEEICRHTTLAMNTIHNHAKNMLRKTATHAVRLMLAKFIQESF